jgi:hypothetical protein
MALVSLERARCSAPSLTKLLAQGVLKGTGIPADRGGVGLHPKLMLRPHCSDPSITKLLAQGTLNGIGVTGEGALF